MAYNESTSKWKLVYRTSEHFGPHDTCLDTTFLGNFLPRYKTVQLSRGFPVYDTGFPAYHVTLPLLWPFNAPWYHDSP